MKNLLLNYKYYLNSVIFVDVLELRTFMLNKWLLFIQMVVDVLELRAFMLNNGFYSYKCLLMC